MGLYYMDDFSFGKANTVQWIVNKEQHIWLWHHCLGHPSFFYLKHLFPSLFFNLHESDFRCETCIQAQSHHIPYPIRLKKCDTFYFNSFECLESYSHFNFFGYRMVCDFFYTIVHVWLGFIWWKISMRCLKNKDTILC